jgi:hypothetical protein
VPGVRAQFPGALGRGVETSDAAEVEQTLRLL